MVSVYSYLYKYRYKHCRYSKYPDAIDKKMGAWNQVSKPKIRKLKWEITKMMKRKGKGLVGWPWRSNILSFFLFSLLLVARRSKVLSLFLFLFLLIVALVPLSFLLSVPMTGQVCWYWGC